MAELVDLEQYQAMMAERPRKFTPEQVGFRVSYEPQKCSGCIHWYKGIAMEHDVCEIMRPKDEQVPWNWVCKFWTDDGQTFPLYEEDGSQ